MSLAGSIARNSCHLLVTHAELAVSDMVDDTMMIGIQAYTDGENHPFIVKNY
jgi:hypothetical protein